MKLGSRSLMRLHPLPCAAFELRGWIDTEQPEDRRREIQDVAAVRGKICPERSSAQERKSRRPVVSGIERRNSVAGRSCDAAGAGRAELVQDPGLLIPADH